MAKATLPTNYMDDILNSSMDGKRRYNQVTNSDGTVSLEDVSTYDQVGSNFGASQLNAISKAVNESADSSKIISDPDTASATTEQGYIADVQLFNHLSESLVENIYVGTDGKLHKVQGGADTVLPFSSGIYKFAYQYGKLNSVIASQNLSFTVSTSKTYKVLPLCIGNGYIGGNIVIKQNGTTVKTISSDVSGVNLTEFSLVLNSGDSITITITNSTTNAAIFGGLIFY